MAQVLPATGMFSPPSGELFNLQDVYIFGVEKGVVRMQQHPGMQTQKVGDLNIMLQAPLDLAAPGAAVLTPVPGVLAGAAQRPPPAATSGRVSPVTT